MCTSLLSVLIVVCESLMKLIEVYQVLLIFYYDCYFVPIYFVLFLNQYMYTPRNHNYWHGVYYYYYNDVSI